MILLHKKCSQIFVFLFCNNCRVTGTRQCLQFASDFLSFYLFGISSENTNQIREFQSLGVNPTKGGVTDDFESTGVLFWDLSAAFDTLDPRLLCQKLEIYGCYKKTCGWFNSFLTGQKQRVKIGHSSYFVCYMMPFIKLLILKPLKMPLKNSNRVRQIKIMIW